MIQGRRLFMLLLMFSAPTVIVRAQVPPLLVSYPEYILYNGKIVTVDNPDTSTEIGTIAQAIAVRQGKILAVGANADIQSLAGPQTKKLDLKGRTVLPGMIATHEHPDQWAMISPYTYGQLVPDHLYNIVSRYLTGTPKEMASKLEPTIREAVSKAKPGEWVRVYTTRGYLKEYSGDLSSEFTKLVNKSILDRLAPNNPLEVRDGAAAIVNSKALAAVLPKLYFLLPVDRAPIAESGTGGTDLERYVDADSLMQGNTPLLAKLFKAELQYWASIGMTAFSSAAYSPAALQGLRYLDQSGEFPVRMGWAYTGPDYSEGTLQTMSALQGTGTDHMWLVGAWPVENGGSCTTINAKPEVKRRESCNFAPPGSPDYKVTGYGQMYDLIKNGLRIATMHSGGDKDIDYYMDIIEQASKDAGFTLDQIRAKRHAFDHMALAPRPAQYERIKRLGMMASGTTTHLYNTTVSVARDYGEEYTSWVVPRKSLADYGIMNTFETDSPLSQHDGTIFEVAAYDLHRIGKDGKVHAPGERMDRNRELKVLTTWGSYYLLKEKQLGSLEAGKWADLIVLDRDYLTIPESEVSKIKVLATMVGGNFAYAGSEFASENGMSPVGFHKP